jgi:hypothetical protein
VTFEEDDDDILAHCLLLMFMTLVFLDEAFADVSTPQQLYSKRNPRIGDLPIRFKTVMRGIPVLRRLDASGSNKLSPTLAWDVTSATNDAQRVCNEMGCDTRFTYYNIRRAIANEVDGNPFPLPLLYHPFFLTQAGKLSAAQKLQLFGHQDPKDRVYRRWYQSRHLTRDVGGIFRGREKASNLQHYLSMHVNRDADAPAKLPPEEEKRLYAADAEIQNMLSRQEQLMQDLDDETLEAKRAKIRAELALIERDLRSRRQTVTRQGLREFRKKWFEERPGEILRSQEGNTASAPTRPSVSQTAQEKFRQDRLAVIEALYPDQDQPAAPRVVALERLIAYCKGNMRNLGTKRTYQRTAVTGTGWTQAEIMTIDKFSSLLARPSSMQTTDWQHVLTLLPKRNPQAIIKMSWLTRTGRVNALDPGQRKSAETPETLVTSVEASSCDYTVWTEAEVEIVQQHSKSLSPPSTMTNEKWEQLCELLPGRTRQAIGRKSYEIRKTTGRTRDTSWTEEEIEVLRQHSDSLSHPSTLTDTKREHLRGLLPRRTEQAIRLKSIEIRRASRTAKAAELDKCNLPQPSLLVCEKTNVQTEVLTPRQVQTLIRLRAANLTWGSVSKVFPSYSIKTLKQIHKAERARGVLQDAGQGRRKRPSEPEWFPSSKKRQKTQSELDKECPAIELGELDSEGRMVLF